MNRKDLLYSTNHEWMAVEGDFGIVGITDFNIESLRDLTAIRLPKVGRKVKAKEPVGEIEGIKIVNDLYSPATGEIVEVNADLGVSRLTSDPYNAGWLFRIYITTVNGMFDLMNQAAYATLCSKLENG